MKIATLLLGFLLVLCLGGVAFLSSSATAQGVPPPIPGGEHFDVDDELVTEGEPPEVSGAGEDIIVGPLGVPKNYEITNNGGAPLQIYVLREDGTLVEGPLIEKHQKKTVGGGVNDKILGVATKHLGSCSGTYVPEA